MEEKFSYKHYKEILKTGLKNDFSYKSFSEIASEDEKQIFLRHDIDIDLGSALEIAKIEFELGIKSTFFLMLRSPIYNLFSRENNTLAKEIIGLGHEIGLHYDEGYYPFKLDLNTLVENEVSILETALNTKISSVSFHQPSERVLQNKVKLNNFINTYDKEDMKGIEYLSDSNMNFRKDPIELINSGEFNKIQILTHPIWWGKELNSTEEIWDWGLYKTFERMERQILETERAYGEKRVFKIIKNGN